MFDSRIVQLLKSISPKQEEENCKTVPGAWIIEYIFQKDS